MRIALIEDVLEEPLPAGSSLIALYDGGSQWYNACVTIAATWLRSGGTVRYHVSAQPLDKVRAQLNRLGLQTEELETSEKLELWDWYTTTLGRKSSERFAMASLRTADLSIWWSQHEMSAPPSQDHLTLIDDTSCLSRFNDEKAFLEFALGRIIPSAPLTKSTCVSGLIREVHSDSVYRRLEAAVDGTIEFRLFEIQMENLNPSAIMSMHRAELWDRAVEGTGLGVQQMTDVMRIRSMREVAFVSEWHRIKFNKNSGVTLEK